MTCLSILLICALCFTGCDKADGGNGSKGSDTTKNEAGSRGSTLNVLKWDAPGNEVNANELATIDYSNASEGYICVKYTGSNSKVKLQITTPGQTTYTFSMHEGYQAFPLTDGSGSYHIAVFENVSGDQYSTAIAADVVADIKNEFGAFLYPNQYVDFSNSTKCISLSEELAKSANSDLEVVEKVYDYLLDNFSYDYDKANTVESGYLPDVDATLSAKKGICFDYAAVMATMLRVQQIPTRLEVGYVGDVYHAWISIYTDETGWINGLIEFNGKKWEMMDPTFASTSKTPEKFVPTTGKYLLKYVY